MCAEGFTAGWGKSRKAFYVRDDADDAALDVASFMHRAPLAVQADFLATRVYSMFTTLALRHLTVTDAGNRVLGIVTRKDVMAAVDRSH